MILNSFYKNAAFWDTSPNPHVAPLGSQRDPSKTKARTIHCTKSPQHLHNRILKPPTGTLQSPSSAPVYGGLPDAAHTGPAGSRHRAFALPVLSARNALPGGGGGMRQGVWEGESASVWGGGGERQRSMGEGRGGRERSLTSPLVQLWLKCHLGEACLHHYPCPADFFSPCKHHLMCHVCTGLFVHVPH